MRVTNSMILKNSSSNINLTKATVSSTNEQMTSQKKISKPSDDPVTAIRSLRLSTTLSKINQYYKNNIPDAESWLDVTETALINMKSLITDVRTQSVNGATGTLTADDRNTILSQLTALQSQIYSEGNADYAGRTVFTGYRTNKNLTFTEAEEETSYQISQTMSAEDMEEWNYYSGNVEVPTVKSQVLATDNITDTVKATYNRLRMPYELSNVTNADASKNDRVDVLTYSYTAEDGSKVSGGVDGTTTAWTDTDFTNAGGATISYQTATDGNGYTFLQFDSEEDWEDYCISNGQTKADLDDNTAVIVKSTGEVILGNDLATTLRQNSAAINMEYTKTGFDAGELRPEYYYNCTDITNPISPVEYEKYDEDGNIKNYEINYTVATGQTLTVNTEANQVFDSNILQDINDMIATVNRAVDAHDKVDKISAMMSESQYASDECQASLQEWLDAAQKEADYADANLTDVFSGMITNSDEYLENITLSITQLGCKVDQLQLTEKRMSEQQETVTELQSQNDDLDLSEIIINYTAAYTAYQASLTAAGKLGELSLLNYI